MAFPNAPKEIVFSFDTTGSMGACLDEARAKISDMVQRLQADIPGIRMAIFAHADYCNRQNYITKHVDFTDDIAKLVDFTKNAASSGGGDFDECYELVLYEVRTKLSWTPGSQRALVMIGDANPHEPNYPDNKLKLDWRVEADKLGKIGVSIYSVQCQENACADKFYSEIARRTDGQHLKLKDFKNTFDFLMTVCYKESSDALFLNYETEVRSRSSNINKDLDKLFDDLRDRPSAGSSSVMSSTSHKTTKTLGKGGKTGKTIKALKTPLKTVKKTPLKVRSNVSASSKAKKTATSMKKTKRIPIHKKYLEKYLPKLCRENVPESNFLLQELAWSNWELAMAPPKDGDYCGFLAEEIFDGKMKVQALYEIGIQPKPRTKKYVMYSKLSRGFTDSSNWKKRLLGKKDISAQINDIVKKDCSLFVRRLVLKGDKSKDAVRHALSRYDYAWKGLRSVRDGHRNVKKAEVEISCDMDI